MKIPSWPRIRTIVLFIGGLAGVAHQELVADKDKPTLIILYAGMMGLGRLLEKDEASKPPKKGDEDS